MDATAAPLDTVDVLLVEDDPQDAELTLRALRKLGVASQVHHVTDGVDALAFLFATGSYAARHVENCPKVVLLDLKLPRVDGLEVLKRIKSDDRTRSIPVVALTSSKQHSDLVASYALGINSYIVKPVEFEAFTHALLQLGAYWLVLNNSPR